MSQKKITVMTSETQKNLGEKQGPRSLGAASQGHACTRGLRVDPQAMGQCHPWANPNPDS